MTLRPLLITATCTTLLALAACDRKPTDPMLPSDPVRSVPRPEASRPAPSIPDTPAPAPMPPAVSPAASAASGAASGAMS